MKCIFCGMDDVPIRSEHCPRCGKKIVVDFDKLAESVHEDAAVKRGERVKDYLKWVILALLITGALIYGVNHVYDRPLVYDGSALPALSYSGTVAPTNLPDLQQAYTEPRPSPPVPALRLTAFGYRSSPIKEKLRAAAKGDVAAEKLKTPAAAIAAGLKWLALNQHADGCWWVMVRPEVMDQMRTKEYQWGHIGVTSLALLAFFGEGDVWQLGDPTKKPSMYGEQISKGVRFLVNSQDPATGRFRSYNIQTHSFDATEGEPAVHFMYNQGMATLAMCEAAGLSGDPVLRDCAQKGLDYIVKAQTEKGGWNYRAEVGGTNDTSLSAWQVQALYAGREAGLNVPAASLTKALDVYKQATQAEGYVQYEVGKEDKQDRDRVSLCGVALMVRQLLGEDARTPVLKKLGESLVRSALPPCKPEWGGAWKPGVLKDDGARSAFDPYRIYFATYGLFFLGGKDWETWHDQLKRAMPMMQQSDGCWRGNDNWSECGGTTYSTALSILSLQVYYRMQ